MTLKKRLAQAKEECMDFKSEVFKNVCGERICNNCNLHLEKVSDYECTCRIVELYHIYQKLFEILENQLDIKEQCRAKELTVDQISQLLGYTVKVIGENGGNDNG